METAGTGKQPYQELEEKFAAYIGTRRAVSCSSGTAALHLAMAGLGIGPGDEVIVPEFSMIATAWAVSYTGAIPVFVDCGPDLNIDPEGIKAAITPKTKAIIVTHVYGRPCAMEWIANIAAAHDLFLVEDACEAHGGEYGGRKLGAWSDVGCFSLYRNKIIQCEEGGLITTDNGELADRIADLKSMAFGNRHDYLHERVGFNYRITNMQAAHAAGELARIEEFNAKRRQVAAWYDEVLAAYALPRPAGSVIWVYDILLPSEEARDRVLEGLRAEGVAVRYFFKPMSMQPMYLGDRISRRAGRGGNAYDFSRRGLYLPVSYTMHEEEVNTIAKRTAELAQD